MLTLGVSTSSRRGSVAVVGGGELLAREQYDGESGHAERLFAAIDRALASARVDRRALELIACDVGPGSFTSVRVGVAAMQGAAQALAIPTAQVSSLEAMAFAARRLGHERVLPMLDAKKSEVFFAVYGSSELIEPRHIAIADLDEVARLRDAQGAVTIGEIAATFPTWEVIRGVALDLPDAEMVALAALARPLPPPGSPLTPLYVRAPDAKPTLV